MSGRHALGFVLNPGPPPLKRDAEERARYASPSRDVFERTQALLSAVRRTGCRRPKVEDTKLSEIEQLIREQHEQYLSIAQRGYSPSEETCQGRIIFTDGSVEGGKACIQCEHFDADTNKDHFHDTSVGNGSYNLQYIEAVLWEDEDEYTRIELEMLARECGPLLPSCSTVANCTSQKATCAYDHHIASTSRLRKIVMRAHSSSSLPLDLIDISLHFRSVPRQRYDANFLNLRRSSARIFPTLLLEASCGDYYEFELACMDREANTSAIFARVYVNQQSAQAHFLVFKMIHEIVLQDTGNVLEWRHIHGSEDEKSWEGRILSVTVDQHRGQALGLGLYLQWVARQMPETMDIHEPWRTIQSLDPYEHLRRCMRLCTLHLYRNIKTSKVTDEVRWNMRSLICVEHDDWDGTVEAVRASGKAGAAWVQDKETCKFAFPGMCAEKSFIPTMIWKAGDRTSNLIETAHRDVNREGVHCSLVGGLQKGFAFDMMKLKTLQAYQEYGVNPSYRSTHIAENAFINLKRRGACTGERAKHI
ncbi:hypothetical protein C8F01DRAFT_1264851 [Mycena amicta]|nr:hypothetical protein C8F01DRAFT_1264851 [Mycena amicta]